MTLEEIKARMAELRTNLETLAGIDGDFDDAQRASWEADTTEWDTLETEKTKLEGRKNRLDAVRAANLDPTNTEPIDVPTVIVKPDVYDTEQLNNLQGVERGAYLYDHASRAIESWSTEHGVTEEWQEAASKLIAGAKRPKAKGSQVVAEHVLRFGAPEYVDAFYSYLEGGNRNLSRADEDAYRAALNEGTTTQGGFIVPPFLDPSIILTNAGISNPFRGISTVKTIGTQTWKGVTSAGVTAEWTAEAAEVADASPTVAQPTITPIRADAYVQASREMLEDTNIATEIAMLFADAKDRLEGTAFAVGTGSTQPTGIVTALQLVTASRVASTTNGSYGAVDVFAVDNNLPQRWRGNASWVANKSIWNLTRQFAVGGTNTSPGAFWTDFGGGRPAGLIGYSVYESSAMFNAPLDAATASNDDILVLGDFSQYYIVDRIGMEIVYNDLVLGSNRRPTGEVAWVAFWRVGANTVNSDAFRMLRV